VGKLGYLQATAPVLTAGAEADDIIHGGGYTCQRFLGGKCRDVDCLKLEHQISDLEKEALIPAWG